MPASEHRAAGRLVERLNSFRSDVRSRNRYMKRVRNLYIRLVQKAVMKGGTFTINFCAKRMIEAGMYAPERPLKECRYGILRRIWKNQGGNGSYFCRGPMEWHTWRDRHGWTVHCWERDERKRNRQPA